MAFASVVCCTCQCDPSEWINTPEKWDQLCPNCLQWLLQKKADEEKAEADDEEEADEDEADEEEADAEEVDEVDAEEVDDEADAEEVDEEVDEEEVDEEEADAEEVDAGELDDEEAPIMCELCNNYPSVGYVDDWNYAACFSCCVAREDEEAPKCDICKICPISKYIYMNDWMPNVCSSCGSLWNAQLPTGGTGTSHTIDTDGSGTGGTGKWYCKF